MKITKRQLRKIIKETISDEANKIMTKPSALGDKKYSGTMTFAEEVLNVAPPEVKAHMSIGRNGSVIRRAINRLVHDIARGQKRWYEEVITHEFEDMRNQSHFEALGYDALFAWDEAAGDMLNWDDLLQLSGFGPEG